MGADADCRIVRSMLSDVFFRCAGKPASISVFKQSRLYRGSCCDFMRDHGIVPGIIQLGKKILGRPGTKSHAAKPPVFLLRFFC